MSVIYERRSIRKFKKTIVDKTLLDEIVRAGMYAPSAGNAQPWHFIIVDNKEVIKKIQEIKKNTKVLDDVNSLIVVLGDRNLEKAKDISYADLGASTENILLRAKELGLDTCWLSVYPYDDLMNSVQKLFKLPPYIYPFCVIAVGYSDMDAHSEQRFHKEKIHYNEW
ncbi:nitroreductase family protein [Acholeplasma sp. OttesenSCG-928-E16]|nr:nitroreductase family protein [Acholeplasma sp. OttesenSCG-928-E16]